MVWAPISELYGRRLSLLPGVFGLGLFSIGTATSQNATSVFLTRFFGGVFGSAPVSNAAAALGDLYDQETRGTAVAFYAVAVVGGPTLGPIIGAAVLVNPHMGWRWTEYILAILTFTIWTVGLIFLPETYPPVLLKRKAARLRSSTGNTAYYHPHESIKLSFRSIITKHLSRPLIMLLTEPTVTFLALYASFVYALLYTTLEVFPLVFQHHRHWPPLTASLSFLPLFIGVLAAVAINLGNQHRYIRISRAHHGRPVPEARMPPVALGGLLFTTGLFWFGFTAEPSPHHHWILPLLAASFIGAGFNTIFQQCVNFLIDTYTPSGYAASAVSANTLLRSVLAAGLPLASRPMFRNMGVPGAMSVLGGLAGAAVPLPFVFMRYGERMRRRSRWAGAGGGGEGEVREGSVGREDGDAGKGAVDVARVRRGGDGEALAQKETKEEEERIN